MHKEELQPITVPEISAFLAAVYKERSQAVAPAQVADDTVQVVQRAGSCEAPDFLERLARALAEVLCAGPALPEAAGGSP